MPPEHPEGIIAGYCRISQEEPEEMWREGFCSPWCSYNQVSDQHCNLYQVTFWNANGDGSFVFAKRNKPSMNVSTRKKQKL